MMNQKHLIMMNTELRKDKNEKRKNLWQLPNMKENKEIAEYLLLN
jgi:hypothetical protein